MDERIRDILNDETTDCDVLKRTTPAPKLLEGLPEKLSGIPKTPISKRVEPEEQERIERATFNTARDSLLWFRQASELVFGGTCRANQTEICDALKRKFGCRNPMERTLQEIAAVNLQSTLSTVGCYISMAAALEPAGEEEVRVRRKTLDAITGGTEFNPQLTGRGSKGTRKGRTCIKVLSARRKMQTDTSILDINGSPPILLLLIFKRNNRIFYEDDNEWEPVLQILTALFPTKIEKWKDANNGS